MIVCYAFLFIVSFVTAASGKYLTHYNDSNTFSSSSKLTYVVTFIIFLNRSIESVFVVVLLLMSCRHGYVGLGSVPRFQSYFFSLNSSLVLHCFFCQ